MRKTRFRNHNQVVRPDGSAISGLSFKTDLDKMTPESRIKLLGLFEKASRQYIMDFTEKWMDKIKLGVPRFSIAAVWGIIRTMPPVHNEFFIRRTHRLSNIAEGMGYIIKFSKWRSTKEYGWILEKAD